jgi:hypothetical protein
MTLAHTPLVLVALLTMMSAVWADDHDDPVTLLIPQSTWTNQLGSVMTITAVNTHTGEIAGSYRSGSGTSGDQYPLVGWFNSLPQESGKDHVQVVSFTVRWGTIGSVTTWNGSLRDVNGTGVPTLTCQWILVRPNTDFPWEHMLCGQDTFIPVQSETPR